MDSSSSPDPTDNDTTSEQSGSDTLVASETIQQGSSSLSSSEQSWGNLGPLPERALEPASEPASEPAPEYTQTSFGGRLSETFREDPAAVQATLSSGERAQQARGISEMDDDDDGGAGWI
jgi:hypothetical protein